MIGNQSALPKAEWHEDAMMTENEAKMTTKFAWCIERHMKGELHYFRGVLPGGDIWWSADPYDACRFSRQQDADALLYSLCDGIGRSAEHGWDGEKAD